jgi:hypothetical protein
MRGGAAWIGVAVMTAVVSIFLAGCATVSSGGAGKSQSDLLQEAGFTAYTPKTPAMLAYLDTLPAHQMVSNMYQGQNLYLVCTDPGAKQCYLGDKAAYQRFQQLAMQASIAEDQHKISVERSDPEFWRMWVDSQGGR